MRLVRVDPAALLSVSVSRPCDAEELLLGDEAVPISVGLLDHLHELFVGHGLTCSPVASTSRKYFWKSSRNYNSGVRK